MSRTTIMASDDLLDELRQIAKEEGISLGEVVREALAWRAKMGTRMPSFVGMAPSGGVPHDAAARHDELIAEYLLEKHSRY